MFEQNTARFLIYFFLREFLIGLLSLTEQMLDVMANKN